MTGSAPTVTRASVLEDHDAALAEWERLGIQDRILVHLDAHHDLWWTPATGTRSIANFLCEAVRNRLFRQIYWVVPDGSLETRNGRAALRAHLEALRAQYGERCGVDWQPGGGSVTLSGCRIHVCGLASMPSVSEAVVLDVDVDYLVIPRVAYGDWDRHGPLPWRWPADLACSLRSGALRWDVMTIAYSVNGGYTPMRWKYLGSELAARLDGASEQQVHAYDLMRTGAEAEHRGHIDAAESSYRAAAPAVGAAAWYNLAYLLASNAREGEARDCLGRAIQLDPSYRSPYSTPGLALYRRVALAAARRAFQHSLRLDPDDPVPHVGLGWLSARAREWKDAEARARLALTLAPVLIDAHRLLGEALAEQGRTAEAIDAYETSLTLALAGHRPLDAAIVSGQSPQHRLLDADHARTHALLAHLHARAGDRRRALTGYRIAVAGGYAPAGVQFAMTRLLSHDGRWVAAGSALVRGSLTASGEALSALRRGWRRWTRPGENDRNERVA